MTLLEGAYSVAPFARSQLSPVRRAPRRWLALGAALLPLLASACRSPEVAEWSRFRGPNGSGVAQTQSLPIEFGPDKNVVWKTPLPPGHSSPILSSTRVFLTAFEGERLFTYCLDRESGEVLWRRESPRLRKERLDPRNSPASPSPVTDGESVFVFFPDYGLIAYDMAGNEMWSVELGPFNNVYGMGASPIVVDDKVILVTDQSTDSYLVAFSKQDGSVLWKTERPEAKSGHATPILYEPEGQPAQLIVPGSFILTAYSIDTGDKLWWVKGLSFEIKSTPVISGDVVYINGYGSPYNQPGKQIELPTFPDMLEKHDADGDGRFSPHELKGTPAMGWFSFVDLRAEGYLDEEDWSYFKAALASTNGILAIKLGGSGDVTDQNVRWTYHKAVPQLPSPLIYENVLYMVNDGGIVTTLDPQTGEVLAQGRLDGAVDNYYASPVAADGKIYFVSELGLVAVLEPGGSLDVLAVSDLDDLSYATPAIEDGRIYLRTRGTLYCFSRTADGLGD